MSQRDSIDKMTRELDAALAKPAVTPIKPTTSRTFIGGLGKALTGSVDAARALIDARETGRLDIEIDPANVHRSRFANRLDLAFQDADYQQLKQSIAARGQEIPILVRPLPSDAAQQSSQYEIAYGHRRHQACLDLGKKVRALVRQMTDRELIAAMDVENRERADLSAYEDALQIRRWLDNEVFKSNGEVAEATGRDRSYIGRLLSMLELPPETYRAFRDPRAIRARWIQPLMAAAKAQPDVFIAEAARLAETIDELAADDVLDALIRPRRAGVRTQSPKTKEKPAKPHVVYYGRPKVMSVQPKNGGITIRITKRVPESIQTALAKLIEEELVERLEQEDVPK